MKVKGSHIRDNFNSHAPHTKYREELDHPEVLVLYAIGSVIVILVLVLGLVWWL